MCKNQITTFGGNLTGVPHLLKNYSFTSEIIFKIIDAGFGNYRFYYRNIYFLLEMLIKTDEKNCIKHCNLLFKGNIRTNDSSFFHYLLFRILFLEKHEEFYKVLINKNPNFQDEILSFLVKSMVTGSKFFLIVAKYILVNALIFPVNAKNKVFWEEDSLWQTKIDNFIKENEYWYYNISEFIEFMLSWNPKSQMFSYYKAEISYYINPISGLDTYLSLIHNEFLIKNYNVYYKIGNCYKNRSEDNVNAKRYYSLEIDINGTLAALNNLALIKFEEGDLDGSIADLSSVLSKEKNSVYLFNRAGVQFYKNDLQSALNDLNESINLQPCYDSFWYKAFIYKVLGDFSSSINTIKSYHELYPKFDPEVLELEEGIAELFKTKEINWPFTYNYFNQDFV